MLACMAYPRNPKLWDRELLTEEGTISFRQDAKHRSPQLAG